MEFSEVGADLEWQPAAEKRSVQMSVDFKMVDVFMGRLWLHFGWMPFCDGMALVE